MSDETERRQAERIRIGGVEIELPASGTGARAARRAEREGRVHQPVALAPKEPDRPQERRGPSRRWMALYVTGLSVAVLAASALALVGVSTLRDSNAGRRVSSASPDEPGFEGLLEPTPTMLVLHRTDDDLHSATLLSLTNQGRGGAVLVIPAAVEVLAETGTLATASAEGVGADELRLLVEVVAGIGIQEVVQLDHLRLAELVGPAAPLAVDSPVSVGDKPAGPIELGAEEIGPWLAQRGENETDEAASYRVALVWQAWVAEVAAADDVSALVPGELDVGLGRFVAGLAGGRVRTTSLPVEEGTDAAGAMVLRAAPDEVQSLITEIVPHPTGALFVTRTLVRLLDGTGDAQHVPRLLPTVVGSQASVVIVGNADAFDYETTEIRYHRPDGRAAAERLREALGVGEVIEDVRPIDAFDVTIVLGSDA